MQNANRFDKNLKENLARMAERIEPSETLKRRVMAEINQEHKEEYRMKKTFHFKKVFIAAAAFTVLGSAAVFAGSSLIKGSFSVTSPKDEVTEYADAANMTKELGYDTMVNLPETLGLDFAFQGAVIGEGQDMDETGNPVGATYKNLYANYFNQATSETLNLNISKSSAEETALPDGTLEYNGVILSYSADNYVFLSDESQLTAEDKALEAAGELYISYGDDDVIDGREEVAYENVSWTKDGIFYLLSTQDAEMGQDSLFALAQEWMDGE